MNKAELLRGVALFQDLPDELLRHLGSICLERRYRKGSIICREDESGECLFLVISGKVRMMLEDESGREFTLGTLGAKEVFGEMSVIDGQGRSATVTAEEDSELLIIYRRDFLALVQRQPLFALHLLQTLSQRLRRADEQIKRLAFWDVRERVAKLFLEMAAGQGKPTAQGILIQEHLTHEEIAHRVGSTRETVTRIISKMQREKSLRRTKEGWLIQDEAHLKRMLT